MIRHVLLLALVLNIHFNYSYGAIRRCFKCRSRGDLGDCGDPFMFAEGTNVTDVNVKEAGIQAIPCASGWCGKQVEGTIIKTAYDLATERKCLLRPPSDNEERCSEVLLENKRKVFMCFCRGDLCNSSPSFRSVSTVPMILLFSVSSLVFCLCMER